MNVVFLSNYFNHHQSALSDALWKQTGGSYTFLETAEMSQARRQLGYGNDTRPYTLRVQDAPEKALRLIREADVVIAGSAPECWVRHRVRCGKLLLRYSERPLRRGLEPAKYLPRLVLWHLRNPRRKPIYMLCAGIYTPGDYSRFFLFRNRMYQWGYFPETKHYPDIHSMLAAKDPAEILWCGRFLPLKHPDDALAAARELKERGYAFHLTFLGMGEMEPQLRKLCLEWDLKDRVRFLGPQDNRQVRKYMERVGIFLFTSDHREGWGAVLNEAMNSGCAVIANSGAGASEVLLRHGKNGILYSEGNRNGLCESLRDLLEHPEKQKQLGQAAYETIRDTWNAEVAAKRVLALSERMQKSDKKPDLFEDGPCSLAKVVYE